MQASSTIDQPAVVPASESQTWTRAYADVADAFRHRELWLHLGWQDIKQRYRRSVIGPLWITIGMGVTALALGILYSQLMTGTKIPTFLPYITVGFIVWNFMLGCMLEGTDTFISNEGLIKHLPAPMTVYVLRTVWRQFLLFLHNLVIYFIVAAIFFPTLVQKYRLVETGVQHPGISWSILLAIPAFAVLMFNGVWVSLLFGIIATRFRDIPPVINSLVQLIFFMTPIVWSPDVLIGGGNASWKKLVAEFNPLYHYMEIVRAPLLGQQQSWHHWAVVGGFTVVGSLLAMFALKNYRARISYWV